MNNDFVLSDRVYTTDSFIKFISILLFLPLNICYYLTMDIPLTLHIAGACPVISSPCLDHDII